MTCNVSSNDWMIKSIIISNFFFFVNKFSEKVYLPCDAFYIGSLILFQASVKEYRPMKKPHTKKQRQKKVLRKYYFYLIKSICSVF